MVKKMNDCPECDGSGFLEDCNCGDDTCCCLNPQPKSCDCIAQKTQISDESRARAHVKQEALALFDRGEVRNKQNMYQFRTKDVLQIRAAIQSEHLSEEPIGIVINNNQPGWTNIIETKPNVTLEVGTKLYALTAQKPSAAVDLEALKNTIRQATFYPRSKDELIGAVIDYIAAHYNIMPKVKP
jgi:hypothetical protein